MKANQLANYREIIEQTSGTIHLLLGNGFSIACDPVFKYNNIFKFANNNGLSIRVQKLFDHFGTTNFELVAHSLGDIEFGGALYGMLQQDQRIELREDLQEVKDALINAIAQTHLCTPDSVSQDKRDACVAFLRPYQLIFTTNYDLLLYWSSMQCLVGEKPQFQDGFRSSLGEPSANYVVFTKRLGQQKGLLYLHGALHLFEERGETRKHCWKRSGVTLTDNVIAALECDHYPLFVAEGESLQKLEHIQRSGYLSYCYQKLQAIASTLVVCGSSLGDSDEHILHAIADSDCRTVWLGVYGAADSPGAAHMELVAAKLHQRRAKNPGAKPLATKYYDVSTAPMWGIGSPTEISRKAPAPETMRCFGHKENLSPAV